MEKPFTKDLEKFFRSGLKGSINDPNSFSEQVDFGETSLNDLIADSSKNWLSKVDIIVTYIYEHAQNQNAKDSLKNSRSVIRDYKKVIMDVLGCSTRTIYRNMSNELKKEKELLNQQL